MVLDDVICKIGKTANLSVCLCVCLRPQRFENMRPCWDYDVMAWRDVIKTNKIVKSSLTSF